MAQFFKFQSTRPSRGETRSPSNPSDHRKISIHSPLAGRDASRLNALLHHPDFNPLAPRGARLQPTFKQALTLLFQSTRPSRGETIAHFGGYAHQKISIHSPLAGRDGEGDRGAKRSDGISIHSPLAGRD